MGKKKNLPVFENIEITGVAAEGKALVRINDIVTFVPNCVPGDVVDLQITKKKHSFMEAKVLRVVKPSDVRCAAKCPHFGVCGGCKWQILPYDEQLKYKQQQIVDNLTRIGKIDLPEISPILGSKHIYEYRNKLEFTCADRKWLPTEEFQRANANADADALSYGLGFHIPNCFDKVLDITECITFYNEHTHEGLLRTIILRNNHKGELMLIVCFGEELKADAKAKAEALLNWLHAQFPEIISLLYVENLKFNDTIGDLDVRVWFGQDHIIEEMEGLRFKVGPKSFYQTNTEQAYELYKVARSFAFDDIANGQSQCQSPDQRPLVYDLYTGTGTIANFVARQARQVIGIEYVPEAIEDAKANADANALSNTLFFAGDMKDILNDAFVKKYGRPDVIITDPPRAGMHEDVVNVILNAEPKRIVYVSCNPATQARDLALLDAKYRVTAVQPVDMFPHTQHVENVVRLDLKA